MGKYLALIQRLKEMTPGIILIYFIFLALPQRVKPLLGTIQHFSRFSPNISS